MSSLFNKEDEDKLLPPEPCADQYVCVCVCVLPGVRGWFWDRPGVPFFMSFPSDLFDHGVGGGRGWEGPAPGCFHFSQQERNQSSISGRLG